MQLISLVIIIISLVTNVLIKMNIATSQIQNQTKHLLKVKKFFNNFSRKKLNY